MSKHLKTYLLPLAMLSGVLFYKEIEQIAFVSPYLIFLMLLVPYCRLSLKELKIRPLHISLLTLQVVGSLVIYYAIYPFNRAVAEGAFICLFCPTATSAPVITAMLGGNIASLVSYSIFCNLTVAVLSPFLFSFIGDHTALPFFESFWIILRQIVPLLLAPMLLAVVLRKFFPSAHKFIYNAQSISFYLWAIALVIVLGRAVGFIVSNGLDKIFEEMLIAAVSLAVCSLQFYFGKKIGSHYGDRIAGGQALGQKNTILCIWMSFAYLSPLASVAPATYIVWQNIINSWQLWKRERTIQKQSSI